MDATELFNKVTTLGWTDGYITGHEMRLVKLEKIKQTALNLSVKYPRDNFLVISVKQTDYLIKNIKQIIEILNLIKNTDNDNEIMLYCESLTEII